MALAFEVSHPERVIPSYVRYLRRHAVEFFGLEGVPVRIWFRSRFQLRSDEDLTKYLHGHRSGFGEWIDEEAEEHEREVIPE